MKEPIRILSTKKLLVNQKQFLLNANISLVEADFISIKQQKVAVETINENLIFTSQNAVLSLVENLKDSETLDVLRKKNVFCVGMKTKGLLEENGFNVIAYTGYAEDLAEIITLIYRSEKFTFFTGNLRRDTLPEALSEAKVVFNEIQVYETSLTPQKVTSKFDGILFYSPSGIQSYLKNNKITNETCFCIGTTTADALENITNNVVIANQPTVENVIIQCINFFAP
ncbi:uroporphyrinogen-III synthase [Flavobacterium tegetincola]|uniref:uroporphyrinogen-III synthase n=1 Tax=Flavobacterium tegetincola TaxID=150172 RepID=UPI00040C0953|nr:uroporphyrinogen-III synthase [Flavobacterium tegetincola]